MWNANAQQQNSTTNNLIVYRYIAVCLKNYSNCIRANNVYKEVKVHIKKSKSRVCLLLLIVFKYYYLDSVMAMLYTTKPNPILFIASAMLYHKSTFEELQPKAVFNHPPSIHMYPIG